MSSGAFFIFLLCRHIQFPIKREQSLLNSDKLLNINCMSRNFMYTGSGPVFIRPPSKLGVGGNTGSISFLSGFEIKATLFGYCVIGHAHGMAP